MARGGTTCAAVLTTALCVVLTPRTAKAFDSKGHQVIEALVYRTLIEGHGAEPARPTVLRDLINDGALVRPICFGDAGAAPEECLRASVENPLLGWPEPRTDRPDANFRRQFSDPGQCFHFMGTAEDEGSAPLPRGLVPRALATTAIVRCRSLLDDLLRQVVLVGGRGTRESGYGLYELMHAVGDSFSRAHAERKAGTHAIELLRVWEPGAKLAGSRLGAYYSLSPTRHDADEPRDRAYVRNFAEVDGRPCRDLTGVPYAVPFECLSEDGELARQALVELLVTTRDLRVARLASPSVATASPETTGPWTQFKEKWFTPVHPCQGEECTARQPAERAVSSDAFLGVATRYDPGRSRVRLSGSTRRLRADDGNLALASRPGRGRLATRARGLVRGGRGGHRAELRGGRRRRADRDLERPRRATRRQVEPRAALVRSIEGASRFDLRVRGRHADSDRGLVRR